MKDNDWACARYSYPLRLKPASWILLELYGMNRRCLKLILYSYETTEHKARGREGVSEE